MASDEVVVMMEQGMGQRIWATVKRVASVVRYSATASSRQLGNRPAVSASELMELRTIQERFTQSFLRSAAAGVPEPADRLAATQRSDGSWADLETSAAPIVGQIYFRPFPHVHRLRKLAASWRQEERASQRDRLAVALARGLDWWLAHSPVAKASWYQEVGVPTQLAQAVLFAEPLITDEQRAGVLRLMRTSVRRDGSLVYSGRPATGQNLIWEAQLQVLAGCLLQDPGTVARYARRAEQEMQLTTREGLQHDCSFHQHGPQLYAGGYGQNFAEDCARLVVALADTRFAFQASTIGNLIGFILDGQQWMVRGCHWDFGVIGRWIAWPDGTRTASDWRAGFPGATGLARACQDLQPLADGRRDECAAMVARLEGRSEPGSAVPCGCRVFWRSDFVVLSQPDFRFSVRMSSRRVYGTETSPSGQGLLNWHLGDGTTCLMRTGREYDNIAAVWNWRQLPGVTCVALPDEPLPRTVFWGKGSEGGSAFAGGVSDGAVGIAAMELARGGARARKAWFLTEHGVVCLGCGIRARRRGVPLLTGVEQCWADGAINTSAGHLSSAVPERHLTGRSWVTHAGVAYVFGAESNVRVRTEDRHSGWETVNTFIHSPEVISGRVLGITLEHAANATGSYHYVVVPGLAETEIDAFRLRDEPKVLANTETAQALVSGNRWWLVFWQAGALSLDQWTRVRVDRPALVLLRHEQDLWHVAVGNPTQARGSIGVTLEQDGVTWRGRFHWPAGPPAGEPLIGALHRT
ncbi:MAG: polysaccharide lyase family 8 super-sandwich domain-containing protein [Cyanobacteriota bacterium]|nr:polysaccharide lyase family 8 super-sandwich domain-containing protein [Cyanobacteriota bacterium]